MKKNPIKISVTVLSLLLLIIMTAGCVTDPTAFVPFGNARNGYLEGVRAYVEAGGNMERTSPISGEENTILWIAASEGQLEIVKYLVEQGAYIDSMGRKTKTSMEKSPYAIALMNTHFKVAEYLEEHGAIVQLR